MSKKKPSSNRHGFHPNGANTKKIQSLKKEMKELERLSDPELVEKITAKILAAQNNVNVEDVSSTVERYLSKSVLVNPEDPNENLHTTVSIPNAQAIGDVAMVEKPYVYGFTSSFGGASQFRLIYPFNSINAHLGNTGKIFCSVQNQFVTQEDIIPFVRAFVFKNPWEPNRVFEIHQYKLHQARYQYKLIADIDDNVFEYPEYHPEFGKFTIDDARNLLHNLKSVDEVIVSTDNLKYQLLNLGVNTPITVVKNNLPKAYYGTDVKRYHLKDVSDKPKILYNGSNYHYANGDGDFDGEIKKLILDTLNDYEWIFMGVDKRPDGTLTLPSYLQEPAKRGQIKIMPFYAATEYPYALRQLRPDYVIAPLAPNPFNEAKSDLRYLEAAAIGAVFIGSKFENGLSPYQNLPFSYSEKDGYGKIKEIIQYTKTKDIFNESLKAQYDELNGRWMDDVNHLLNYVKIFSNGINGVQLTPEHEQYQQFKNVVDADGFLR